MMEVGKKPRIGKIEKLRGIFTILLFYKIYVTFATHLMKTSEIFVPFY